MIDLMDSIPDMPTHEPDTYQDELTKATTNPVTELEEQSVLATAVSESSKTEVEVEPKVPVWLPILPPPSHRSPDQSLTPLTLFNHQFSIVLTSLCHSNLPNNSTKTLLPRR